MSELLLELYGEEIPARMQQNGSEAIKGNIEQGLKTAGLEFSSVKNFYSAQRLSFVVEGLSASQADAVIDRKGPKVGAVEQALAGFCKSVGVASADDLSQEDGYYYFRKEQKGKATKQVLPEILNTALSSYTWPKSMRSGSSGNLWVRPLHNILCIFAGDVIDLKFNDIKANNKTYGHRFMANKELEVSNFADYAQALEKHFVVFDQTKRQEIIVQDIAKLTASKSCILNQDRGLLQEVVGLVEYPVAFIGNIEEQFMHLPEEVLVTSMKSHQKYFSAYVKNKEDKLAPFFICVANVKTSDNQEQIIKGNEKVLRARLADAKFFWEQDSKLKLQDLLPKLKQVVFHNKAGTVYDKVERITKLSGQIADIIQVDKATAMQAAKLAKADLVSGMVEEFASLQGIMGGYYAKNQGESHIIANAIKQHYMPAGQNDACPSEKTAICVSLADKIDSLNTLWQAGERATGSKDPYGLRRYALSIIRLITENNLNIKLSDFFPEEIQLFIVERLKFVLKAEGFKHDLVNAVIFGDDILLIKQKAAALNSFLQSDEGSSLLASYKRAANILAIEEKKDGVRYDSEPLYDNFVDSAEKHLYDILEDKKAEVNQSLSAHNYTDAMKALSTIKPAIDAFFEKVMVNDENPEVRKNRLKLLNKKRRFVESIADLSKID